jgi:hypothetical protein
MLLMPYVWVAPRADPERNAYVVFSRTVSMRRQAFSMIAR